MSKVLILEPINSREYNITIDESLKDGKKVVYLIIQDRRIISSWASYSGLHALAIYKGLKRLLRGGKVPMFDQECRNLLREKEVAPPQEVVLPPATLEKIPTPIADEPVALTIKLYAGDVLVRVIHSEEAWIAALNSTRKGA